MSNHALTCPHCGDDQRHTFPCCKNAAADHARALADYRAEQARRKALLERLGIEHRENPSRIFTGEWATEPHLPSLFAFLHHAAAQPL